VLCMVLSDAYLPAIWHCTLFNQVSRKCINQVSLELDGVQEVVKLKIFHLNEELMLFFAKQI